MKKSFMTRALATGLSLAMAFSLSAATNVTTAAAAAKPAMKSTKMTIKVGQSKNYQATAATQKSYKISKIKLSAAGKTKVTAKINSSKKSIKLTGKAATKSTNVVITFKNNKTKKLTKVTTKAVVKEAEKPDEAYKITSAEVTGAKKITVKLNKAVANAASITAIVKKGTGTKDSSFTVEGSDIVITTDTKLVVGTYSVAIGGLETSDLTASVEVAKDETLTSYEIGKELIADADSSTNGSIYYKALNQYGEMMTADAPNVTCSFTSEKVNVEVTATATREGKLRITNINTSLAILGTKGTVVLVDQNLGVNTTGEVTYSAAATAAEVKVDGMYNSAKSAFQDITAKDDPASYLLLMTITDQYGHQLDFDDIKKDVGITIAGGITGIESNTSVGSDTAKGLRDFSVGEKDYIAAAFKSGSAKKGSATVTMVNNKRGLILTHTIEVVDYVVIANLVLSADDGIYNKQENVISYEATDTNGNAITSFAVLSKIAAPQQSSGVQWMWQKNTDGSAKLICKPDLIITSNASHTASTTITSIFNLNDNTSSDFKVKTQNFTVKEAREVFAVQGLAADAVTQFSSKAGKHSIDYNKIIYADQYANKVTKDDDIYPAIVTSAAISPSAGTCAALIVTSAGMKATVSGSAFEFESTEKSATATVYLKYYNNISNTGMSKVTTEKYDYKFVVTCVDTEGADTASFKIAKVFDGYVEDVSTNTASKTAITEADIKVTATIGGTDTTLDPSQYTILKVENGSFTTEEINKKVDTKDATVTVQVTSFDSDNMPANVELKATYKISYADPYAYSIEKVSTLGANAMKPEALTTSASAIKASGAGIRLDAEEMQQLFVFKNQYGEELTYDEDDDIDTHISYSITPKDTTAVKVYGENGNKVYATADRSGTYLLTITATPANGKSVTKDFYVYFPGN